MSDPAPEDETRDERLARLLAEAEQARREVERMTGADTGTAVSGALVAMTGDGQGNRVAVPAEVSKRQMAEVRAAAIKKQAEIKAITEQMRAEMEARIREMQAVLSPLQEQVKRMEEGIWTINLYLGRDEEIVRLLEGAPAPADTPLTLRQEVLSMDEETAAHAEEGGIDARNLDVFDEWISQPQNLARVLPEPKGVVVLVPRKRGRDYKDPWTNQRMAEENRWSYFLIRNGENLYRMSTDFVVGKHLIPGTKEFTDLFYTETYNHGTRQRERVELVPGTRQWDEAAKHQDAKQRHYMRMALILQGLVDRTPVFHPLPAQGINLLDDRTYTEGIAHLVLDAEHVIADGRPDFYAWLDERTAQMTIGMRIMGAFNTQAFKDAGGEGSDRGNYYPNDRLTPRARDSYSADKPETGALYRLEGKKTDRGISGFIFKFERTTKRWMKDEWGREELRAPKTRGTCLVAPGDRFIIPFDLVTVEECRYYLSARSKRHAYEHMFPLLQATIAAKEAEQAAEEPFRDLLARTLIQADPDLAAETASDPDLRAAYAALDPLVDWWKFVNKHHRALTGSGAEAAEHEAKAIRDIVAEHLARKNGAATQAGDDAAEQAMIRRLTDPAQGGDPTIMVVARTRDGGYLAFAPMPRSYPAGVVGQPARNVEQPTISEEEKATNDALHPTRRINDLEASRKIPAAVSDRVWAREYATGKTGRSIKARDWVKPSQRLITAGGQGGSARIIFTSPVWEEWDLRADPSEHLTDPEIDQVLAEIMPEIETNLRGGYPRGRRWQPGGYVNEYGAPADPLFLGITWHPKPGQYTDKPYFEVYYIDAAEPAGLNEAPSAVANNSVEPEHHRIQVFVKKTRNGVAVERSENGRLQAPLTRHERHSYTTATPGRPWNYYWSGQHKDSIALVEYPENQAIADARAERAATHNTAVRQARSDALAPLKIVKRLGDAQKEAQAYARFLDDYADPDLWEGHKKTLRADALEISMHPFGRDVPGALLKALYRFHDEGRSLEGYTVRSLLVEEGVDIEQIRDVQPQHLEEIIDLPLWEHGAE